MEEKNSDMQYTHRLLGRIVIEAVTPLAIGTGSKEIATDALVATDVNRLPYIPATTIAGVLRSMMEAEANLPNMEEELKKHIRKVFGFCENDEAHGSEIIFTDAKILNHSGVAVDGLQPSVIDKDELLKHFRTLPIRQHVRMTDKGVAADSGKFDEQVVYAGTRFCFEVEMVSDGSNESLLNQLLSQLNKKTFRIGGGTRSGFGEIKVVETDIMVLDLRNSGDREVYLKKTSDLGSGFWATNKGNIREKDNSADASHPCPNSDGMIEYTLSLKPESYFMFGSGFGDDEADKTPVKAKKIEWNGNSGTLKDNLVLIPAASVKGALAHRVAFYLNRRYKNFAGSLNSKATESVKKAMTALFGSEGNSNGTGMVRGNLIFSDVIESEVKDKDKLFNHVAIDRFTGGAIEGALFSEKATFGNERVYKMTIIADKSRIRNPEAEEALENALKDLCKGLLPLGGSVNRGHGVFTGSLTKNNETIL